jgi:hypothetical protein
MLLATVASGAHFEPNQSSILDDVCRGSNPYLATVCYPGLAGLTRDVNPPVVLGVNDTPNDRVHYSLALAKQVGGVWGLAYRWREKALYAAAYYKRGVPFGPGGPGGIYRIDVRSGAVGLVLNVPNAGANRHDARAGGPDYSGRDWVGKNSLGGIDLDPTGTQMFVMNVAEGRIYRYSMNTGQILGSFAHGASGEAWVADARPFALKYHQGRLYHGVVNSAQSTQRLRERKAHVYESRSDATDMRLVASFSLDYRRGGLKTAGFRGDYLDWEPWRDGYNARRRDASLAIYPQPMLVDIEFDAHNNMAIGLRDRQEDATLYVPCHKMSTLALALATSCTAFSMARPGT